MPNYNENKSTNIISNELVFSSSGDNEDIIVWTDKICLSKIIDNIFGNAIKFTTNGKITVTIKKLKNKQKTDANGNLLVSIKDNGIGINPIDINRIFSMFHTTSIAGMRLGLYISKSLVVALGGKMWVTHNEE